MSQAAKAEYGADLCVAAREILLGDSRFVFV